MKKISKTGLNKAISITAATFLLLCLNTNAQNLLVDSTFDTSASVASWTGLATGFAETDPTYGDTNFFRYDDTRITTDEWLGDNLFANVSQVVSGFTGDQSYDVTVAAYYDSALTTGSYDIFAKFVFLDSSDGILSELEASHDNNITSSGSGFITLYDGSLVTPTDTAKINVLFFANENGADNYLKMDALSFTATIPEPGSYAMLAGMLGLGYVMISRRKVASR